MMKIPRANLRYFLFGVPAFIFIVSGYAKLMSIELLEITLVELGFFNWTWAPLVARLFISIEFLIAVGLLIPYFSKIAARIAVVFLFLLCIYLIHLVFKHGLESDCGCFGIVYRMNGVEALLKNAIMMGFLFLGLSLNGIVKVFFRPPYHIMGIVIGCLFVLPFVIIPIEYSDLSSMSVENFNEGKLDTVVSQAFFRKYPDSFEPVSGKKIIAFLSLSCLHCRIAARKLQTLKNIYPDLPVFFALNGDIEDLESFYQETKTNRIPNIFLFGKDFIRSAGLSLPVILLVNGNDINFRLRYVELNEDATLEWVRSIQ